MTRPIGWAASKGRVITPALAIVGINDPGDRTISMSSRGGRIVTVTDTTIDTLNSLLRGELSATETYQQALAKVGNDPAWAWLKPIHAEHRESANTWRQHVHKFGGKPDQDSGVWGFFAKAVEGTATLFGNKAALQALKQGEQTGIGSYENALSDQNLPEECRSLIQTRMLPQTRAHLATLDRLLAQ